MDIHDKLNIPEGLHGLSLVKKAVKELKFQIWLQDIPSPTVPEYVEHHQSIQDILKFTDEVLEIIDDELARYDTVIRTLNTIYGAGFNYRDTDNLIVISKDKEDENAGL